MYRSVMIILVNEEAEGYELPDSVANESARQGEDKGEGKSKDADWLSIFL